MLGRQAALLLASASLAGCSSLFNGDFFDEIFDKPKDPIPGKRETILTEQQGLVADLAGTRPVSLPPALANPEWAQAGRLPTHVVGNLAGGGMTQIWEAKMGIGSAYRRKVTAQPLVVGGRVFTMDSSGNVAAFDLQRGSVLWRCDIKPKGSRSSNVGGGIGVADNVLYAATGLGELLAITPDTGKIIWRSALGTPARSAPTIAEGRIFLCTIDDRALAYTTAGKQVWAYQSSNATTSVLGIPAPAYADGVVVAGFGSGDLVALRAESGAVSWTDNLSATGAQGSLGDFAAVQGMPVIDQGTVFAIGVGGLILSVDLPSGRRLWSRSLAGAETPCLAGDWIFAVNNDQRVVAMQRSDGQVRWITDLPRYGRPDKQRNPIYWMGPLLANGKLLLAGTDGSLVALDAASGKIGARQKLKSPAAVIPSLAAGKLLLISDDGNLHAMD